MAFLSKNLSVLAYANGFTLWHYTTPDTGSAVAASGYFAGAADAMRVGDMIIANVATASEPSAAILVVSAVDISAPSVSTAVVGAQPVPAVAAE